MEALLGTASGLPWEMVKTRVVVVPVWGALPGPSTAVGRTTGRGERLSAPLAAAVRCCWGAGEEGVPAVPAALAGSESGSPVGTDAPWPPGVSAGPPTARRATGEAGEPADRAEPAQPVGSSDTSARSMAMAASTASAVPEAMAWAAAERRSSSVMTAAPLASWAPAEPAAEAPETPEADEVAEADEPVGAGLLPERTTSSSPLPPGRAEALFGRGVRLGMMPQLTGPCSLSGRRSRGVMRSPVPGWRRAPGPRARSRWRRAGAGRHG